MSITIGQGITFGTGSSSITYWANYTGTDFVYLPTPPDPWGIYYWATGSYLEITLSAWSNSSAFNNLLTVSSGSVLQLDPAGYGSLINFTSTSGWVSQGNGVYRMTGTWAFGGPTFDSGITNFKFTYVSTTFLGGITVSTGPTPPTGIFYSIANGDFDSGWGYSPATDFIQVSNPTGSLLTYITTNSQIGDVITLSGGDLGTVTVTLTAPFGLFVGSIYRALVQEAFATFGTFTEITIFNVT